MPLMMDEEMDMDDLFGDGAGLALPSRPPTKDLHQRLDELRASGCCQAIAWSKWGSIASIAANGSDLELRNLRVNPEDGSWALSEPTLTPSFSAAQDGIPLKHLSWSPTGSDLAVIDASGRVTILDIFSSLNKPSLKRSCQLDDPADDLHAVVGCYWLNVAPFPVNRPAILNGPGVKDGPSYRYEASQAPVLGPSHPSHSKSAFVFLTTNGSLRLLWTQNNGKWFESHTELESIVSSDDLITHAAICPDKNGSLLVAFATTSKQLRTVRALIEWNQPKADKNMSAAQLPLNPTLRTRHLAVTSWAQEPAYDPMTSSSTASSMVQLSHLEFLPPAGGDSNDKLSPPTILAIRSHLPVSTTHYNQDVHTIIDRWEVHEKPQTLHPAFEQLSSRRNSVGSPPGPVFYLKKMDGITVDKIAIGLEAINLGKVVFFAFSDGSVEYRERHGFEETFNDGDLERVWHLSQIGFTYTEDEPRLQVALSPTFCSLAEIRNDGKVKWKKLGYHLGDFGSSMEEPMYAAVITALALSSATAVMRNVNYDDLLASMRKHASAQLAYDWLTELSRILKVHWDYSEETHHDVLVRNTTIQLHLCIQNSLGFKGEYNARTFSGKFAWLVLQLRNIVVLVTMAANLNVPGPHNEKQSPLEDPEVINSLAGSVRWVLDLMAWLTDALLMLPTTLPANIDLTKASNLSLPDLLAHLHSTNTVSLHLLLSSPTRGFLTAICRRLQHLDFIARKALTYTGSTPNPNQPHQPQALLTPALRAAYVSIALLTSNTILKFQTIEKLLSSLTTHIKSAYSLHTPSLSGSQNAEKQRNALEIKMLFGGSFPDAFKPVIVELFKKGGLLESVREEIDPGRLFFADFTMLEVDEDALSVRKRKGLGKTMDCFKKSWLINHPKRGSEAAIQAEIANGNAAANGLAGTGGRQGARWRRCARCASVMEDVLNQRPALQWLVMQQRRCFCSGYWDTLGPGEMIATEAEKQERRRLDEERKENKMRVRALTEDGNEAKAKVAAEREKTTMGNEGVDVEMS